MEFRLKITGCYAWLPHAIAAKRSLLRMFHSLYARTVHSGIWKLHWNPEDHQSLKSGTSEDGQPSVAKEFTAEKTRRS